jgi:dihydropteroate synthase
VTDSAAARRPVPADGPVLEPRPELGGGRATPAFALPDGAPNGIPSGPGSTRIGPTTFTWGARTYLMGILNVTPDSFSGDGLLAAPGATPAARPGAATIAAPGAAPGGPPGAAPEPAERTLERAVALAVAMADAGADLLDVGGESTRPGHAVLTVAEEIARVVPIIRAVRAALPDLPISVDTTKPAVAAAALEAGADLINDVWGVADDDSLARLAADRHAPIVLMHNRGEARYTNLVAEVIGDLQRAIERALRAGVAWERIIVDPGFGFGKTAEHNLALLRELPSLALLGRPILLGTSRKSTLGRILDLPADQRLEATLATTALAIAAGVDMVRVHDVRENARAARTADAVVRGTWPAGEG